MPIASVDLTTNSDYTLSPMILTDTTKNLFTSIISNIELRRDTLELLETESETELNRVITSINNLKAGANINVDELEETVANIIKLESENGDNDFVSVMQTLFTELNRREEADKFRMKVSEALDGQFTVDLSAYGFESQDEYQVICKVPTLVSGRFITATYRKTGTDTGVVTLRDKDVSNSK